MAKLVLSFGTLVAITRHGLDPNEQKNFFAG